MNDENLESANEFRKSKPCITMLENKNGLLYLNQQPYKSSLKDIQQTKEESRGRGGGRRMKTRRNKTKQNPVQILYLSDEATSSPRSKIRCTRDTNNSSNTIPIF